MTDFLNQVRRDAQDAEAIPKDKQLSVLSEWCQFQLDLEDDIEKAERRLDELKKQHREVSGIQIPDLMQSLGISDFTLKNGLRVKVSPFFGAKIPEPLEDQAFDWLEENHHEGIIKGEFIVQYKRADKQRLGQFIELANEMGFSTKDKLHVHPMTLKAFVKEQITSGQDLPRELFGVYTGWQTKISKR